MEMDGKLNSGIVAYSYSVVLGASYIFAFWRPIGFNIFPYLSLKDFLTTPFDRVVMVIFPPLIVATLILFDLKSNLKNYIANLIILLLSFSFIKDFCYSLYIFYKNEFFYENEISLLMTISLIFIIPILATAFSLHALSDMRVKIAILLLVQLSTVMCAGYRDGKATFSGAQNIYFLENKTLCGKDSLHDWVYLSQYSQLSFFMNTIDKKICILKESNIILIPRYYNLANGNNV